MNRKEAVQVLAILKASYPNQYRNLTQEDAQGIVSVWSVQFANIPADIVLMALNKAVGENDFPPTIAEIKRKICSVHSEASTIIERHHRMNNLTDEEFENYKRIYKATEKYKFGIPEPSIREMIPSKNVKQIGRSEQN